MRIKKLLARFSPFSATKNTPLKPDAKVIAAHYFGEHSPIGFWADQDLHKVGNDFQRLRDDGFNSIVLVIPWPLFQPTLSSEQLDPWYVDRLKQVIKEAKRSRLRVVLRVGFVHHPSWTHHEDVLERPLGVFEHSATTDAFVRMLKELQAVIAKFDHVDDVFMSWEELWPTMDLWAHLDEAARLVSARRIGFGQFLSSRYALSDINEAYGIAFASFEDVPIPARLTPAMKWLIEFFDATFKQLLMKGRTVMPQLSVEVRPDGMPTPRKDGGYDWIYHDMMSDEFTHRSTYWGPFYGAKNQGDELTADEALQSLNYLLAVADPQSKGDLLLEQFNFVENTFTASHNSRIASHCIDEFLDKASIVICEKTRGYGVWATRDYRENFFANASFQRGAENWSAQGIVKFQPANCVVNPGAQIAQSFVPGMKAHSRQEAYQTFVLEVVIDSTDIDLAKVRLVLNGVTLTSTLAMDECRGLRATFPATLLSWNAAAHIAIDNQLNVPLSISRCYVFGFVQRLGMYDHFGREDENAVRVRRFNTLIGSRQTTAANS
jgi:hypothetical protein